MPSTIAHSAFSRIGQLASLPRVHAAFQWFHLHERKMMQWQQELVSIAAPPFGEGKRAEWLAERFRELKLEQVEIDPEGNVLGCYPGNRSLHRPAMRHAFCPHRYGISHPYSDCSVGGAQSSGGARRL